MTKFSEDGMRLPEEDDVSEQTEAEVDLPQNFEEVDQDIHENLFPSAPADEDGRIL